MAHLLTDGIGDHGGVVTAPEQRGRGAVDEGITHAFIVPKGGSRASRHLFTLLHRRQDRGRDAGTRARHWLGFQLGERGDARHLFDQIGLALHVGTPGRNSGHVALHHETQTLQRRALNFARNVHPDERGTARGVQTVGPADVGHLSGDDHVRNTAATKLHDQRAGPVQTFPVEGRIDAAFVAIARVGIDLQRPSRLRDGDDIPDRRLDKDVLRLWPASGGKAAHDAADALNSIVIGNDQRAGRQHIFLFVQPGEGLAPTRAMNAQTAGNLCGVKDVQRAVQVMGEEVGDIDERGDRAQTDALQLVLQPRGRGAVLHPLDIPASA